MSASFKAAPYTPYRAFKNDMNRLWAFEIKCLRRILNIKWQQKIKNKKIMKRMGIGLLSVNIVHRMMERKLNFFGHICRMPDDRLIRQVVFAIIDDKNKRGRLKRRWTDDLVNWCNKDIGTVCRLVMDRTKWTHFVKYVNEHCAVCRLVMDRTKWTHFVKYVNEHCAHTEQDKERGGEGEIE